jgi:hypothetical protein
MFGLAMSANQKAGGDLPSLLTGMLSVALGLGGFVLALLLGVGMFISDLDPKVNVFWRSRPISASQWYWIKYVVSAGTLLMAVIGPLYVSNRFHGSMNSVVDILSIFAFLLMVFSFAAMAACLVRHTLYASILGTGFAAAVMLTFLTGQSHSGSNSQLLITLGLAFVASRLRTHVVRGTPSQCDNEEKDQRPR